MCSAENPPLSPVPDMTPSDSQNVEETRSDANIQLQEISFFSNEYSICISNGNLHMCFL